MHRHICPSKDPELQVKTWRLRENDRVVAQEGAREGGGDGLCRALGGVLGSVQKTLHITSFFTFQPIDPPFVEYRLESKFTLSLSHTLISCILASRGLGSSAPP